jgi:peptidyl-prolyl cis-trans isomerase C
MAAPAGTAEAAAAVASVNGVPLAGPGESLSPEALRRRAGVELLRQRAVAAGLCAPGADGPEFEAAVERLLEQEIVTPEPTEAECRRYYEAHPAEFTAGELAFARHILFQVTPGAPVPAVRAKAELTLLEVMKHPEKFEEAARECSNCPSGRQGGSLGQLGRGDTVPEFERVLFDGAWTGVHPQLVRSRYGFHILAVDRREPGRQVPFESCREQVSARLRERVMRRALAQYVSVLAGQAEIVGVDLQGAATPLVR